MSSVSTNVTTNKALGAGNNLSELTATAATARTNLELGSIATQAASAVAITGGTITGIGTPGADSDVAIKSYVDTIKQGLFYKDAVRVATAAALPAYTRVTNVITASAFGVLTVDGVAVALNDRILLKDGAAGADNGIYTLTTVGTAGVAFVLTRSTDADADADVKSGMYAFISEGTSNADSGWVLTTNDPITLNTTALSFTQFSGAGQVTAGAGLTKTGNTLDVNVDNSSIEISTDALRVKALGVTNAMLAGSIDLTAKVTGTLPVANGGTGVTASTGTVAVVLSTSPTLVTPILGAASATSLTLTTDLAVADGGTGVSTLTDGGFLFGAAAGAIEASANPTNGQLPIGSTGANPVIAALTGTANRVTVTNGAGTITLTAPQDIHTAATPTFGGLTISGDSSLQGGVKVKRTTVGDAGYAVLTTDFIIAYTVALTAARTVALPAAATATAGKVYIIKDETGSVTATNKITVDGNGAENIDGVASVDITVAYGVLRIYTNGTNWFSI